MLLISIIRGECKPQLHRKGQIMKVRETMQALIDAKFDHEKLLKVQLTFLDQANAAHKVCHLTCCGPPETGQHLSRQAWAMVVSQQCAADSKFDRVGGYRSSE